MSIVKHIPNTITSLNLACGVLGVVFACQGRIDAAFFLMLASAVFDFCDGLSARLLGAYSDMGKELDSLADLVSFGVLPSLMMRSVYSACSWDGGVLSFVPLVIAVFSGLRLAKFNVDERQHSSFLGLATPVCALLCSSLCYYVAHEPLSAAATLCATAWFVPAVSALLAALLVSELPMFSMKFSKADSKPLKFKRISFAVEVAAALLAVLLLGLYWPLAVCIACVVYILKNVFYKIFDV